MGARKPSREVALEVVHTWGGSAQHAELFDGTRDVVLGDVPAAFLLPPEALGGAATLVLARADVGAWTLRIPAGASATVEVAGKPVELASLPCDEEGARLARLATGDRAELTVGDHTFFVRGTAQAESLAKAPLALAQHRWLVPSLLLHAAFLLGVFLSPPSAGALVIDLAAQERRDLLFHTDAFELPPPPDQPVVTGDDGGASEGHSAAGEAGTAGNPDDHRHTGGQVRVRGESDDRRVPLTHAEVVRSGILGSLATLRFDSAVSSPFGAAEATGFAADNAYGDLNALTAGFSAGAGGLAPIGHGRGGCAPGQVCDGAGTVGVGNLNVIGGDGHLCSAAQFADLERRIGHSGAVERCTGGHGVGNIIDTGRGGHVPQPIRGTVTTVGGLSREEVRRVIQRHTAEIRGCYEQGLIGNPDLAGRVAVQFMISPTGAVSQSLLDVRQTDLANDSVNSCVTHAVERWNFPSSPGPTVVSYPFRLDTSP